MIGYIGHQTLALIEYVVPSTAKSIIKGLIPGADRIYYRLIRTLTRSGDFATTIQSGLLQGRQFRCSLRNERDYWLGTWEPEVLAILRNVLKADMVVFDVGAHIGYFTLIAAILVKENGRVIAFEPSSRNFENATANLALNQDLASRVELLPLAVSDSSGVLTMPNDAEGTTVSLQKSIGGQQNGLVEVKAVSLDDFVSERGLKPDFVKMDIEGGERLAIEGMNQVLVRHRPIAIVEIHDSEAFAACQQAFNKNSYRWSVIGQAAKENPAEWLGREQYIAIPAESNCDLSFARH